MYTLYRSIYLDRPLRFVISISVLCPVGTYFNVVSLACEPCRQGTYQPSEGQLTCLMCPANTSTSGDSSKSLNDCKGMSKSTTRFAMSFSSPFYVSSSIIMHCVIYNYFDFNRSVSPRIICSWRSRTMCYLSNWLLPEQVCSD